jgi:hypothetical protein
MHVSCVHLFEAKIEIVWGWKGPISRVVKCRRSDLAGSFCNLNKNSCSACFLKYGWRELGRWTDDAIWREVFVT